MNNLVTIYHIPNNPNILKGRIYTLYLNKNTNLELSSILNTKSLQLQDMITSSQSFKKQEPKTIAIPKEDYTRLLELNNLAYQLSTKRAENVQKFMESETKITTELSKIHAERGELIKRLTKGSELKS